MVSVQGLERQRLEAGLRRLFDWAATSLTPADMEIARSMSGLFWFIGGTVTALLLPFAPPTEAIGEAGWIPAIAGVLIAFLAGRKHFNPDVSLRRIYLAGYAGVLLIVVLEWMAGGRETPYHYLYMLPILFAAAVQSLRRVALFGATVAVLIWAPLLYEGAGRAIVLDIATQLVTLFAIGSAVWALFVVLRVQRRTIREQRERAELMAREDSLTGLGNRRAFTEALIREVARARREGDPLGVIVADLDHFKEINDRSGHAAGDEYLRRSAEALLATARAGDTCFRWGGDEFAVLLPGADREQAEAVAQRLRDAIRAVGAPEGSEPLEMTCGVAELDPEAEPEALIAAADRDLLKRKRVSLRPS